MRDNGGSEETIVTNATFKNTKEDEGDGGRYGKPWKTGRQKTNQSACGNGTILHVAQ